MRWQSTYDMFLLTTNLLKLKRVYLFGGTGGLAQIAAGLIKGTSIFMDLVRHEKKFQKNKKSFRRFIKEMDESELSDVVPIAQQAEQEVWQEINCLQCANCCNTMTPTLTKTDRERISTHLNISKKELEERYLAYDKKSKEWQMAKQPCIFLDGISNKCTIYEVRPADCREFPHLTKLPLEDYVYIHKQNIKYCPATYRWVEKMMDRIEFNKK